MGQQTVSRVATSRFHQWLLPEKTVIGLLSLGLILVFVGAILLGVASLISGMVFSIVGGLLLAAGLIILLICICLCAHACCVWHVHDKDTQTVETTIIGADQVDGEWYSGYGTADKRVPNGVLRDGRQQGSLTKKHVTISPRSTDSFSSGYMSGRQADGSMKSSEFYGPRSPVKSAQSGPGSVSSDMSTLASFAYLNNPSPASPYSSMSNKNQSHQTNIPIQHTSMQHGFGSVPRNMSDGRMAQVRPYYTDQSGSVRTNLPPERRHSDDDYDNAGDMVPILPQQTYHPQPQPSPWQHEISPWQHQQQQQQQHRDSGHFSSQWQHSPQQTTVWQYQTNVDGQQQPTWRPPPHPRDEMAPAAQPLVRPSQKRPMTFEQISSSKVSLYDNIHMNRPDEDE
ncbi:hypothetical protein MAR_007781 [Mya arenaria]|uniref:Uncharacterized protein n=1 Tax=Mya arenaria TaxID=6604 RepID=A0ABY7DX52_MYAAR|nr:uncharacterized protein LOC128232714 [Mya arenaria]WAR01223.1 hypothetical protein MAR_007781 [Mya arenaria]